MNTSDRAPGADDANVAEAFAREIGRLANRLFASDRAPPRADLAPSGAVDRTPAGAPAAAPSIHAPPVHAPSAPPTAGMPNALAVGAGGASPGVGSPQVPGPVKTPPLATAPAPKGSDLRGVPTMLADTLDLRVDLAQPDAAAVANPSALADPGTSGDVPYYLLVAGLSAPSPPPPPGAGEALALPTASILFQPDLVPEVSSPRRGFDPLSIKRDFPILQERVHGRRLVWLDNAATTQKPHAVIDRLSTFYERENSNIHRAAHALAARATDAYEGAREKVRRTLNAPSSDEIVFVRGATEAINLVAQTWGRRNLGAGDEIVVTWLEHHANIVPWQQLCSEVGCRLRVVPVDSRGEVILEEYERLLGPKTRLVSLAHVSNALGTVVPVREMTARAHREGALVLVDGAQSVSHMPVDVQDIDCDFFCFSGHKVFGPTGIGALFGKAKVLDAMPPWQGGGNMIADVTFERTRYRPPPGRFEAGTGNIADAVGLGAALDYLSGLGLDNVRRYEHDLLAYAERELERVPGLRVIGNAPGKAGVVSFVVDGLRTEDIGAALDQEGIAVRSGHHCAQPILRRFGLESTVRASFAPYNTREDVDALVSALLRLRTGTPG